jgi:hypothetical protein
VRHRGIILRTPVSSVTVCIHCSLRSFKLKSRVIIYVHSVRHMSCKLSPEFRPTRSTSGHFIGSVSRKIAVLSESLVNVGDWALTLKLPYWLFYSTMVWLLNPQLCLLFPIQSLETRGIVANHESGEGLHKRSLNHLNYILLDSSGLLPLFV